MCYGSIDNVPTVGEKVSPTFLVLCGIAVVIIAVCIVSGLIYEAEVNEAYQDPKNYSIETMDSVTFRVRMPNGSTSGTFSDIKTARGYIERYVRDARRGRDENWKPIE